MSLPVSEGSLLAGKYRVERVLGEGGMGIVAAATHEVLGQRVAVKFLHAHVSLLPDFVERFHREAKAAAGIESEHVARVLDVGTLDNGAPYMVMEYLEGEDLNQLLERKGTFTVHDSIEYILQACDALALAHAARIIHRDLKPANLFLARQHGRHLVKLLDFGISKAIDGKTGDNLTQTSAMMGTALYMSPEQLRKRKDLDERVDIWALGVMLYEFVTGRLPFEGDSLPEVIALILEGKATPVLEHAPQLDPSFVAVIDRCMATDRDQRYMGVGDLALALLPFANTASRVYVDRITRVIPPRGPSPVLTIPPATIPSPPAPPSITAPPGSLPSAMVQTGPVPTPGSRWPIFALAAGAVVLAVGGVGVGLRFSGGPRPTPSASPLVASAQVGPQAFGATQAPASTASGASSAPVVAGDVLPSPTATTTAKHGRVPTGGAVAAADPKATAKAQPSVAPEPPAATQAPAPTPAATRNRLKMDIK
jgi:eukaryotic-like serine/threonine-protein kinase